MASKNYARSLSFIVLFISVVYAFFSQMPQYTKDQDAPLNTFSTDRALEQLAVITEQPHYVGTKAHEQVRNYIIKELEKLGLKVEVQEQEAVNSKWRGGTKTYNIITKIKGTGHSKSLVLLAHYDSTPHSSYGASDDGSGVVTILESLRAYLYSGKKPVNDIIVVISDAEELGLLGAEAFVNHHPWAKNVGLVINFEARGSGGPSYMLLETNGGNHTFIKEFQKAHTPYPVGNSLMYSIYKMLPNDTDLTVFREKGDIDGFNFAFIDDHFDYHSAQDSFDRIDRKTLTQQGGYLMSLLDYFSTADISHLKKQSDDVFFNFPGFGMVYYPFQAVFPSVIIISLLFIILFVYGVRKQKLSIKGSLKSFIPFVYSLFLAGVIGYFGWKLLLVIFPKYQDILQGFPYNGHIYILFFISSMLAVLFWIYKGYFKKGAIPDLMVAPIVFWILLNFSIALKLKGAGFFIIPLIGLLVNWIVLLFTNDSPRKRIWLFTVLAIPTLLLFSPLIKMLPVGLGLKIISVSLVLTVLLFGSLLGILGFYSNTKNLSKLFVIIAVLSFITAYFKSDYSVDRRQPNSIMFIQDNDTHEAFWASYNRENDTFTKQFLGNDPQKGDLSIPFNSKFKTPIHWYKKTTTRNIPSPAIIKNVNDTLSDSKTYYEYIIKPKRKTNMLYLTATDSIAFYDISFNGVSFDKQNQESPFVFTTTKDKPKIISYFLAQGVDSLVVKMTIPKNSNPDIDLYDISFDLLDNPAFTVKPRSKTMMPTPFVINDAVVTKSKL